MATDYAARQLRQMVQAAGRAAAGRGEWRSDEAGGGVDVVVLGRLPKLVLGHPELGRFHEDCAAQPRFEL